MSLFIYPYKSGSKSAKDLAQSLNIKRIKHNKSKFKGNHNKVVINWGSGNPSDEVTQCRVLNNPPAVRTAANKLSSFKALKEGGVRIPNFTTDPLVAANLLNEGHEVVVRHKLTGNSGVGIEMLEGDAKVPAAPLYVQYVPKKNEYRVHVVGEKVLSVQRKARRNDVNDEDVNWKVRNHDNGFIFARNEGHVHPKEVERQAILSVEVLGLDFGAVDIVWNEKLSKAFVLEVNTAPGLTGTTLEEYTKAFKEII